LGILAALFLGVGCSSSSDNDPARLSADPVRVTTEGDVVGADEGTMYAFRGIPYAAPPVEALRFAPPEEALLRSATLDAMEFGSSCPQTAGAFGAGSVDEDCLFLNIFTPKGDGPYPVMVWIHGGAFVSGAGSDSGYDATRLVAENVIVVTLNYRLGALGFLPHTALTAEAGESGNYGLMDQQLALNWIQANIDNFGGDPANVTIFGESAGGHSVLSHMVAPSSDGLFQRAIVQSGSYSPTQISLPVGSAVFGTKFATAAACTGSDAEIRDCFRALTVEEVLAAQGADWYVPTTETRFLPQSTYAALAAGAFADVPVLMGSNRHEGQLFVLLDMAGGQIYETEAAYRDGVAALLKTDLRSLDTVQIADDYRDDAMAELGGYIEHPNRFRVALSNLWTDYMFTCNNLNQWLQLAMYTDAYAYWFTDDAAPNIWDSAALPIGATHTLEIQYVFGLVDARGGSAEQIALSEQMVGFWTQFAKTGNPNAAGDDWSAFTPDDSGFVMKLDTLLEDATALEFGTAHRCAYWAAPPTVPRY